MILELTLEQAETLLALLDYEVSVNTTDAVTAHTLDDLIDIRDRLEPIVTIEQAA